MVDADDPDLRARVAELEATVEAQQETIQQLLPSRRRVLQAGGLLAGGGLLGALSADRASADVTGQVRTQQDRVDVFAGAVDANSLSTKQAIINRVDSAPALMTNQTDIVSEGTSSISTTDDVILSDVDEAVVWVVGDDDGGGKRFIDRLATTFDNQSNTELLSVNNPASRSYTMVQESLQLSVGSGTYNVNATAIRMEL